MMISRLPNSRASNDSAPGPRKTIAADTTAKKTVTSLASKGFSGSWGNQESASPSSRNATNAPATGVRNPTSSAAPTATAARPAQGSRGGRMARSQISSALKQGSGANGRSQQ